MNKHFNYSFNSYSFNNTIYNSIKFKIYCNYRNINRLIYQKLIKNKKKHNVKIKRTKNNVHIIIYFYCKLHTNDNINNRIRSCQ